MQNQNQVKNSFAWKPASKFIEFAFEEGGLRPFGRSQEQQENLENGSPRKLQKPDQAQQQGIDNSYEPSNQVVDFQKAGQTNQLIQIIVTGKQVVDEISHTSVFASKAFLPTLTVNLVQNPKVQESQGNGEKIKFVQLFIGQKSHSSQYQKYKIIKGGLRGNIRLRLKNQKNLKLQKIRFNFLSNPQKLPRLILVVYEQFQNKRTYKSVMISDEFSVIDTHKILSVQTNEQLRMYFDQVQLHFLDKSGLQIGKITSLNKHKIIEEMGSFENYLIKKNKKIWNIVYAAYKYSHIVDLYFLNAEGKTKKQQFLQLWKQIIESSRGQQPSDSQKTCNHLNPSAKFVLKIHAQMRNVRFIIAKEFTKYLSIIASDTDFQANQTWTKFDNISQMKDAYSICQQQIQAKIISDPILTKTTPVNVVTPLSNVPVEIPKKNSLHQHSKNDDEDFNQEDVEDQDDDVEYQGQSSQNYSVSNRKRGRKLGQKKVLDSKKQPNGAYRQNKYPTRGGNRIRNKQDTEDSNDKKANMIKKNKEKQLQSRSAIQPPVIGAPPFRVLNPTQAGQFKDQQTQSAQNKMFGLIPINPSMMMGKKPQDNKPSGMGINPLIIAMPKGVVMMPSGMNPQMMAMMGGLPGGVQVMPMGNGMQAMMMPVQVDKNSQTGQTGMATMGAMGQMGQMGQMGLGGMPGMGGMASMAGMGGMSGMGGMMPFMMGAGGSGAGMPQGFMMPMVNPNAADKSKQTDSQKQKHQTQKKQQKKQNTFPPNPMMQTLDLSKMAMMGQMPGAVGVMPGGQIMGMPQMMQMGMGGMGGMGGMPGMTGMGGMMGASGMPQGIMMNPLMAMQKPNTQNKQEGASKQTPAMPNNMFSGGMPFMMQVPNQLQSTDGSSQNTPTMSNMQMGMMGQFPGMMQMPQQGQMQTPTGQGGMPMGYTMVLNPEQARQMSPAQLQQIQMQMQMMMGKGMMMGMPKNDQNDPSKK